MLASFVHDAPAQRVVFGFGAVAQVAEEVQRLGVGRALVIATPGSGTRLGARVQGLLGARAAAVHAEAAMHTPRAVAAAGTRAAKDATADGLVVVGGGSAIGLGKAIASETGLPILVIPTTYSGSEATAIYGVSEGDRKLVQRDPRVLARTVIYDPELTLALPTAVTAASGMNAIAHCVEAVWVPDRTPVTVAYAMEALRLLLPQLPRAVADGRDRQARGACLAASWLAGAALAAGAGLHHKLAHILGGFGLPHAETHAVILPHVARFNLEHAGEPAARLRELFGGRDPADALAEMLRCFPIPQRLREVGFDPGRIDDAAAQVAALGLVAPRPASAADVRTLLRRVY